MNQKITALFEAIDNISKVALGIAGNLGKLEGVSSKVGKAIAGGLAAGTAATAAFAASSVKVATEFQAQLAVMSVATKDFGVSMGTLRQASLAVGGDVSLIGVSATSAADSITGLAKAGLSSTEVFGDLEGYLNGTAKLGGALRASIDLAAASELDMVQASDLAAVALATFGGQFETEAERAQFVNDAMNNMVQAADASVASVSTLADALKNVGPTAASFGFSLQDTNNALAILSTRGIEGGEAGTVLKSMMTNLMRPTNEVVGTLKELNVTLFDSSGNMKSLPTIIGDLSNAMSGMTQEQKLSTVQTLAGTYGMKAMSTLLEEGVEGWNAMAEATANAAGIQENAAAKSATFSGQMEALGGVIETIQIQVGEALLPVLTRFVTWAAEMATQRGPELEAMFINVAGVLDTLVTEFIKAVEWLSQLDAGQMKVVAGIALFVAGISPAIKVIGTFKTVLSGLQTVMAAAKTGFSALSSAFSAAPGPILAVTAAVAAVTAAYVKYQDVQNKVKEGTAKVDDAWTNFFDEQVKSGASASSVLEAYRAKQELVRNELDKGGIAADLLIRNQDELVNSERKLIVALAQTSEGYADFNNMLKEAGIQADVTEKAFGRMRDGTNSFNSMLDRLSRGEENARVNMADMSQDIESSDARMLALANSTRVAAESIESIADAQAKVATEGLELATITDMLSAAYETAGTSAEEIAARTQAVDLAMGTTSNASVKLNSDMQLISSAFAEGSMSLEAYTGYAQQAQAGTLNLSDAQIEGISHARDHAASSREAAQAADEYRLAMLSLSESLKDVGAQQAAQIALKGLEDKFTNGLISLDQYEAAVISVQDTYDLATPQSRALAEGITLLNNMLAEGAFAPSEYAAAVEAMRSASEGGESSVTGLMTAVEAVVGPLNTVGDSAADAGNKLGAIEEGANRATAALEQMTGRDWIVNVGTSGTLPPGVEPVPLAVGAWNIPDEMLALLHPGEMVLPKELADAIRGGQSGGSKNPGMTVVNNYNLSYAAYQQKPGQDDAAQAMREIEVAAKLRR